MSGTHCKKERKLIGDRGDYFLNRIQGETGENISACYQCERCTNACPVAHYMDIKPHQVIRHIQMGWREDLMASSTIWICLSCEMCTTYCPNEVGVAETINHLRNMAAHSSITPKEKHLAVFHETFLKELQRFGRVNEFWLMNAFNLKPGILKEKIASGLLTEEILLGLTLWKKGRLHLLPRRSKAIREIKEVYRRQRGGIV
ncbi:MAG: heterodisulfide reductase [Deltaproteobacteria bacterium]|mgnify:CR=1 FL=1|jgi:heterodisulfide reductase subunit C2|nr:heterodisulfide reductase [Deltaproteobacteria bacterium]